MSDLYQNLDNVLIQKIDLYAEIIEVMDEERTSISEYSRENLENALQRKELLLVKVHDLNQKREETIALIAKKMGHPKSDVTLKILISKKENPLGRRMAGHREKILEQIQQIQEKNLDNKQLINRSSQAMRKSMSWLYDVDTAYTPYYSNGQISEPTMGSRVVNTDA